MKKDRQSKLVMILALCVSVVGLTLGFAAFSNTLTISSSATVSPDEADFDINVYGFMGESGDFDNNLESYSSSVIGKPISYNDTETAGYAMISDNGKNIVISNLSANLSIPGDGIEYNFLIRNDGKYDAYLNLENLSDFISPDGLSPEGLMPTCVAVTDATVELVNQACKSVNLAGELIRTNGSSVITERKVEKIEKGSYLFLKIHIDYGYNTGVENAVRSDGDFSAKFDDIVLEFSSVSPSE